MLYENEMDILPEEVPAPEEESSYNDFNYDNLQTNTFEVISTVAYLIGVEETHFINEYEPPMQERFQELKKDKNARIVRNLCRIRTALIRNYSKIRTKFYYDLKNLSTLPELIPTDAVNQLSFDGINLQKSKPVIEQYMVSINKELSNRIGNCQQLFPMWVQWQYIKELFLMPNGMKETALRASTSDFFYNMSKYPYMCYINWPGINKGNILYNDRKFLTLLYEFHEDCFHDESLVRGASKKDMVTIDSFLDDCSKVLVVVDCENSDAVKLAAALSSLPAYQIDKIFKILLFDSDYTTSTWPILSKVAQFPLEHIRVARLNEKKSQVDMTLATTTVKEVYTNGVNGVILVSSDGDYWSLIQSISDVNFLVMMEKQKSGRPFLDALDEHEIRHCYIDDFCTGASYSIKTYALLQSLEERLDAIGGFNINEMLDESMRDTWIYMTPGERQTFWDRYIKGMRLKLDSDGNVTIVLNK